MPTVDQIAERAQRRAADRRALLQQRIWFIQDEIEHAADDTTRLQLQGTLDGLLFAWWHLLTPLPACITCV